jgi:hypothetical protein
MFFFKCICLCWVVFLPFRNSSLPLILLLLQQQFLLYITIFFSFSSILKYKRSLYWQKKILNTHDEPKIIYNSSPLLFFPLSLSYLLCPKEEKKIQNNILLYTKFIFFSFQKISTTAHKYTHYTDTLVANLILSF